MAGRRIMMGLMLAAALPPSPQVFPCPLSAGWDVVRTVKLPRKGLDGQPVGGFSAAGYQPEQDRLWLLSDSPRSYLMPWGGLARLLRGEASALTPGPRLRLRTAQGDALPVGLDGEGLVLQGNQAWIVSEGRRTKRRQASLIRFDLATGRLMQRRPLPASWAATRGRGLAVNLGPESLTTLAPGDLLMAAEAPLLQERMHGGIPLARSYPDGQAKPYAWLHLASLGADAGLTDLLAVPAAQRLLALVRQVSFPFGWQAWLVAFPLSPSTRDAHRPLMHWDLHTAGLPADNWEALTLGPQLPDGRFTLVLASDDNFSPLQMNWLAVLAPRRGKACLSRRRLNPVQGLGRVPEKRLSRG